MRNVLLDLKERQVPVILMSDANTFYIETILTVCHVIFTIFISLPLHKC
jgi:hypothetical protein